MLIQARRGQTLDAEAKFRIAKEAILAEAMRLQTIEAQEEEVEKRQYLGDIQRNSVDTLTTFKQRSRPPAIRHSLAVCGAEVTWSNHLSPI